MQLDAGCPERFTNRPVNLLKTTSSRPTFGNAPAGCFRSNGFSQFDMTGNVWERTWGQFDKVDPNSGVICSSCFLCAESFCQRDRPNSC
ncbi:SUMF1/EgtB/PvdO family nonheme iron enzyme [Hyphomonas sp.]|uniref:SUMF1/EgtB/PvdO family nonheme iron enzyme n=1 Tax=Hyphomonas sp. TaxID=87 RepID=UPI003448076B